MIEKRFDISLISIAGFLAALVPVAVAIGNAAAEIVIALIVILFMTNSIRNNDWAWVKRDWVLALLALWLYGCVRSIFTDNPGKTMVDALPWIRFILFAIALESWILRHERWRNLLLKIGFFSISFLAADAILQYSTGSDLFGRPIFGDNRLTASYGKPIVGITIAWLFMPFLLGYIDNKKFIQAFGFGVLSLTAVLLSGERMALMFSLLSLIMVIFLVQRLRKVGAIVMLVFAVGIIGLMYAKPSLYDRQVKSTIKVISNVPDSPYGVIWRSAIDITKAHPIIGIGMGNFRVVCPDSQYGLDDAKGLGYSRCATHPHNIYLEWLTEGGLIAISGFILAMFFVSKRLIINLAANRNNYVFIGLFVTLAMRLWPIASTTSFFHGWSAIPFWLVLGWGLVYCRKPESI